MTTNYSGQSIRLAVVGLRNIGLNHVRKAIALPGIEVVLGIDRAPERRAEATAQCGIRTGAELEDVLDHPDIDAVVLAVPTPLHADFATRCLRAGKHVLVEKPLAATAAECDALIAERDTSQRMLMVGMNQRFSPAVRTAQRLLAEGILGELRYVRAWWLRPAIGNAMWARGAWGFTAGTGGGPLHDLGVHKLDLALHVLGFPSAELLDHSVETGIGSVVAAAKQARYEVEDRGTVRLALPGGVRLDLEAGNFCPDVTSEEQGIMIRGTQGVLRLLGAELSVKGLDASECERIPVAEDGGATSCVDHFVRALRGQEPLGPTAEQSRMQAEWLDAATVSLASTTRAHAARA